MDFTLFLYFTVIFYRFPQFSAASVNSSAIHKDQTKTSHVKYEWSIEEESAGTSALNEVQKDKIQNHVVENPDARKVDHQFQHIINSEKAGRKKTYKKKPIVPKVEEQVTTSTLPSTTIIGLEEMDEDYDYLEDSVIILVQTDLVGDPLNQSFVSDVLGIIHYVIDLFSNVRVEDSEEW